MVFFITKVIESNPIESDEHISINITFESHMKNLLYYWVKQFGTIFFFWLILFFIQRLIFTAVYFKLFLAIPMSQIFGVFFYGLRLDMATIGYLMLPMFCLMLLFSYLSTSQIRSIVRGVFWAEVFIVTLIHVGELGIYNEWRHKLSSRVFMHLSNPSEISRTSGYAAFFLAILFFVIEFGCAILLIRGLEKRKQPVINEPKWPARTLWLSVSMLFLIPLSILFMRGGFQQIPINIDAAYFSNHIVANDAAVNSTYYFGNSYFLFKKSDLSKHVPKSISPMDSNRVKNYYAHYPADIKLFRNTENPNVVFIIFEGWSANSMGSLTPGKSATPFFDKMTEQGVLFNQIFAANTTSEIGNAAILCGFTGIPETPLTLFPEKHRKIKALSDVFYKRGYFNSYLFSGDLMYGNIKGFLTEHHFNRLQDEKDFDQKLPKGKLNFFDEDLYKKLLLDLKKEKRPFFSCVFTGSTHFPYDGPADFHDFKGEEADYLNSLRYADHCLAQFFSMAQKEPWYQNTIFILVSDHGHNTPLANYPQDLNSYRIPLLIYGDLIKPEFRGKKVAKVGSQADVATTLLDQLSLSTSAFPFSRNLLSSRTQDGAFLSTIRGFGFVEQFGGFLYNFDQKNTMSNTYKSTNTYESGKSLASACLYELFNCFQRL